MAINLLVVDDHLLVQKGVACLLQGTEICIVGEVSEGQRVVEETLRLQPDVVLLDVRLGSSDGLALLREIGKQSPDTRVVMLSAYNNPTYIARASALGASDYVLKGATREALVHAITQAASGNPPPSESVLRRVRNTIHQRQGAGDVGGISFTNREMQVLRHIALGLSNREIGNSLGISVETVKEHVQNLLRKLEFNDRTQAAVWAVRNGLV